MKSFRVAEIFGPTIQGEGRLIGTPCHFIRFGGCDYRCVWCDTPHAVLPEKVAQLEKLNAVEIVDRLRNLSAKPQWVVISGGNPLMFDLTEVVRHLVGSGYLTMVETQGTLYKDWIDRVDDVCVSPKPPSSGNATAVGTLREFLSRCNPVTPPYLKVVVFDNNDYQYAEYMHREFSEYEFFLSVGNEDPSLPTVGNPDPPAGSIALTRDTVLESMANLMEKVACDSRMRDVRVLPQMHTLAWGNARGR